MSEPFLSEIKMYGFNFAPRGWALCDGQILPINQNQSLYSLLGTTYGGDGRTSFALPDLRSRSPRMNGNLNGGGAPQGPGGTNLGAKSGAEGVALTVAQIPSHTHLMQVNAGATNATTPEGNYLGKDVEPIIYHDVDNTAVVSMAANEVQLAGGGQTHDNMQPYTVISFCIALQGLFPSRN